jgi:hypothetical protein
VFRKLAKDEREDQNGPVNCIIMGEAYKTGLFAMTPLRICMDSSMKQPLPIRGQPQPLSYEGPASLADLYTLTLGIREDRVTFAKEVSKFYQCMEADKVARHVRRILWRFGGAHRKMNVHICDHPSKLQRHPSRLHGHGRSVGNS